MDVVLWRLSVEVLSIYFMFCLKIGSIQEAVPRTAGDPEESRESGHLHKA